MLTEFLAAVSTNYHLVLRTIHKTAGQRHETTQADASEQERTMAEMVWGTGDPGFKSPHPDYKTAVQRRFPVLNRLID